MEAICSFYLVVYSRIYGVRHACASHNVTHSARSNSFVYDFREKCHDTAPCLFFYLLYLLTRTCMSIVYRTSFLEKGVIFFSPFILILLQRRFRPDENTKNYLVPYVSILLWNLKCKWDLKFEIRFIHAYTSKIWFKWPN